MSRRYGSFTIRPRLARPCYQQSPDEPGDRRTFEGIASRKHLCTVHRNGNLSIAAVQVLLASSGLTPYRCTAVTLEGWALVLRFRATCHGRAFSAYSRWSPFAGTRRHLYGGRRGLTRLGRTGEASAILRPPSVRSIGSCAVRQWGDRLAPFLRALASRAVVHLEAITAVADSTYRD